MVIFVDIDETICHSTLPDYTTATPIRSNIDKINKLYDEGNIIIYWTARGSLSGINWFSITWEQLEEWGCRFNELRMGKPFYDLIICDKAKRIEEI